MHTHRHTNIDIHTNTYVASYIDRWVFVYVWESLYWNIADIQIFIMNLEANTYHRNIHTTPLTDPANPWFFLHTLLLFLLITIVCDINMSSAIMASFQCTQWKVTHFREEAQQGIFRLSSSALTNSPSALMGTQPLSLSLPWKGYLLFHSAFRVQCLSMCNYVGFTLWGHSIHLLYFPGPAIW